MAQPVRTKTEGLQATAQEQNLALRATCGRELPLSPHPHCSPEVGAACLTSGGRGQPWGPGWGLPMQTNCWSSSSSSSSRPLPTPQAIPQGVTPSPCIACCLVITDDRLFTCHEDCQTSFFRSLGTAVLADVSGVSVEPGKEYCVLVSGAAGRGPQKERPLLSAHGPSPQEFSRDGQQPLPPWVLYLSCTSELDRFLSALNSGWRTIYQVPGAQGLRARAAP